MMFWCWTRSLIRTLSNHLEYKLEKTSLKRVDADTLDKLIDKGLSNQSVLSEADQTKLKELFETRTG